MNIPTVIKQGFMFPINFIKGRQEISKNIDIDNLKNNEGTIIEEGGKKVGIYKSYDGKVTRLSPVCTHLGCIVDWDSNNTGWACPCHGAKFNAEGKVIQGPAKKDLEIL